MKLKKFALECLLTVGCLLSSTAFATLTPPTPACSRGTYSNYVHVSWSSVDGAAGGYVIWRNTTSNFRTATRMTTVSAGTTAWNDWSATPYRTYYYWVCPRDLNYTYWYNTTAYDWNWCY